MTKDVKILDYDIKIRTLFKLENQIDFAMLENKKDYIDCLNSPNLKRMLDNKEMIKTVKTFFENNLSLSCTAKALFMHRNTLIYRLGRLEDATGLNIKKFSDAIIFKNILAVKSLIK